MPGKQKVIEEEICCTFRQFHSYNRVKYPVSSKRYANSATNETDKNQSNCHKFWTLLLTHGIFLFCSNPVFWIGFDPKPLYMEYKKNRVSAGNHAWDFFGLPKSCFLRLALILNHFLEYIKFRVWQFNKVVIIILMLKICTAF